jgi:hypothetical protein
MFEKTREVVRKDRYGFPEEEFPHRAVIIGSPHANLSRKELPHITGIDPILAGDVRENPAYESGQPPSKDNFLFTVTVTADLLGGTRNLVFDGSQLYLVHGERKYHLRDEGLLRKRAAHLNVKVRDLAKVFESLADSILHAVAAVRTLRITPEEEAIRQ